MRLFIAIFFPFFSFFAIGRPFAALICFVLQVTLIGWLPATLWAVFAVGQWRTDRKIREALANINDASQEAVKPRVNRI